MGAAPEGGPGAPAPGGMGGGGMAGGIPGGIAPGGGTGGGNDPGGGRPGKRDGLNSVQYKNKKKKIKPKKPSQAIGKEVKAQRDAGTIRKPTKQHKKEAGSFHSALGQRRSGCHREGRGTPKVLPARNPTAPRRVLY